MCVPGACNVQKRVSDPLELQLQTVSHHVCAGNQNRILCKSSQWSLLLNLLSRFFPVLICGSSSFSVPFPWRRLGSSMCLTFDSPHPPVFFSKRPWLAPL